MPVSINGNGAISGLVITTADLSDSSVTTAKIASGAVATVDIADSAVTTAKIADSNVTTAKIAANAVTVAKLAREGSSGQVLTSNGAGVDPSYQTISTTPTTAQVLTATAGATTYAVGVYGARFSTTNYTVNTTYAGSSIGLSTGTWRCMSNVQSDMLIASGPNNCNSILRAWYLAQFLRIS